jgi:tetratricopeptide (TPR) repeat protein
MGHPRDGRDAIADFTKAIDIDPRFAKAYFNRGVAYEAEGHLKKGLRDYALRSRIWRTDRAVTGSTNADFTKEYDRAIADFTKAIEIDPKDASAYASRGVAYEEIGRIDDAIVDYRAALARGDTQAAHSLSRLGVAL